MIRRLRNLKNRYVIHRMMVLTLRQAQLLNQLCIYPIESFGYARLKLGVAVCDLGINIWAVFLPDELAINGGDDGHS